MINDGHFDLSKFKVVYSDRVLNAVALLRILFREGNDHPPKIEFIDVLVVIVNSNGNLQIISDEAWRFQFIPIVTG